MEENERNISRRIRIFRKSKKGSNIERVPTQMNELK